MSSEKAAASGPVAAYAFQQLDTEAVGSFEDIEDVLSAVREEAEQIREQARAAGEAEGWAAGMAAAQEEAKPAQAALADAIHALESVRDRLVTELERDAAEMAVRLAHQILSAALEIRPEHVVDVARNALRHVVDRRQVILIVNPSDLELVEHAVGELSMQLGGIEHLSVQSDRRVARGGAIARTDAGEIDSTLEIQLARAKELVLAAVGGEQADE